MLFRGRIPSRSLVTFLFSYVILLLVAVVAESVVFTLLINNERKAIVRTNIELLQSSVNNLSSRS